MPGRKFMNTLAPLHFIKHMYLLCRPLNMPRLYIPPSSEPSLLRPANANKSQFCKCKQITHHFILQSIHLYLSILYICHLSSVNGCACRLALTSQCGKLGSKVCTEIVCTMSVCKWFTDRGLRHASIRVYTYLQVGMLESSLSFIEFSLSCPLPSRVTPTPCPSRKDAPAKKKCASFISATGLSVYFSSVQCACNVL